jgi:hypothetical protein
MPDISVTASPQTKRTRLSITEIPSKRQDTWNPDSYKNGLVLVSGEKPNTDAKQEAKERSGEEEILTFHLSLSSETR